jgi:hypothetical protein
MAQQIKSAGSIFTAWISCEFVAFSYEESVAFFEKLQSPQKHRHWVDGGYHERKIFYVRVE